MEDELGEGEQAEEKRAEEKDLMAVEETNHYLIGAQTYG